MNNFIRHFPQDKAKGPTRIFQIARVDSRVLYEETIEYAAEHVGAGHIDGISVSEVRQGSIFKAVGALLISCVELELSLMSQDIDENGVLALFS